MRYKVITDYPNTPFKIGDIIDPAKSGTMYMTSMENYPHIFKPLNWWDDLPKTQLPTYVKFYWNNVLDEVREVHKWLYKAEGNNSTPIIGFTHKIKATNYDLFPRVSLDGWLPSTEDEYKLFVETKSNPIIDKKEADLNWPASVSKTKK